MKANPVKVLTLMVPVFVAACAVQEPVQQMSPALRQLTALATCQEHILSEPSTPDAWPEITRGSKMGAFEAAVVIAYDLDGTGIATNAKVIDSRPAGLFDATALRTLERTRFNPGSKAASCTYVRTYSKQRVRG